MVITQKSFAKLGMVVSLTLAVQQVIAPAPASAQGPICAKPLAGVPNMTLTQPSQAVPKAPFLTGDGRGLTLEAYRGRGVVLNFWATWCAPCVKEMPDLDRLAVMLKDLGVDVLPISEDRGGAAQVDPFYAENGLKNLPVLLDDNRGLVRAFGVTVMPTTLLINHHGQEIGRVVGIAEWDSEPMVNWLRSCLGPDEPPATFKTQEHQENQALIPGTAKG